MWIVWDKKSDINGCSAESFLARNKVLAKEETIFLMIEGDKVWFTEGKSILANLYGIDPNLPDDEFIAVYEAMFPHPESAPDPETDTTTYTELAQVYREGVNSIE